MTALDRRLPSNRFGNSGRVRPNIAYALVLTMAVVLGALVVGTRPAAAQVAPAGSLSIQKVADVGTVTPGQTFTYTIQVQCSTAAGGGCVNATLTDQAGDPPFPPYLSVNGPITVTGASTPPIVDAGPPIVIEFQDDLGDGTTGLAAGQIVTISVPIVVDPTIPPTEDGNAIDNTATIDADNADPKNSTATVTPEVAATISAATTKDIEPPSQLEGDTEPITMSLTGTTTSNVPVDTLVIQDPVDPTATPNPFEYLEITDVGTPSLPPGADEVTTEVYIAPDWVDAGGADLSQATGVRYTFTDTDASGIDPDATGSVDVTLTQRDPAPAPIPDDGLQIDNDVQTVVDLGGDTAAAMADAAFNIRQSEIDVAAGKTFDPTSVNAGEPATVTLTGRNDTPDDAVLPLTTMTITEPGSDLVNPFVVGPHPLTFDGFSSGVVWPAGADAATISYVCNGTAEAAQPITASGDVPPPPATCANADVTGFSITFTDTDGGGIDSGGEATVPFDVVTDDSQVTPDELDHVNLVRVDGADADDNADAAFAFDTLVTIVDRLDVVTGKTITPGEIPGRPGQVVIAQLEGQVLPFPDSTVDATQVIVQDPSTVPSPWFDAFAPQSVTATPVPACSTLTVQYTTSAAEPAAWVDVPGLVDIAGPTIVNQPLPDPIPGTATGIRFVYDADPAGGECEGGFPPGTTVAPNLVFGVKPGGPADIDDPAPPATFEDCADTTADAATIPPVESDEACADVMVDPIPDDPGQGIDPIEKNWDLDLLNARSQQQSGITISWSTQGYSGLEAVRISDIPDPLNTPLPDSVYDSFDLVRIDPITPADDPQLTYDQVALTELFVVTDPTDPASGAWETAPGDPCPAACDGTYPGYTLDPNIDPETVIGFRLSYVESPTRADRLDAAAPPVGSGVAASTGNDRHLHPVFELRDELRSDDTVPVIASNAYNVVDDDGPVPGVIDNDVMIEAVFELGDDPFTWFDDDTIAIVDVPVTVNSTKGWVGGPIGIPEIGVPQDEYPRTLVTLSGTNTTPAKIDELVITDDTGVGQETFEWFNLAGFTGITPPADIGADAVEIELTGATPSTYTSVDDVLDLTEAELVDVTQITVTYTGRINIDQPAGAGTATVEFGLRLREFARSDGTTRPTTTVSPIDNQVTVDGADLVGYPDVDEVTATSTSDANMALIDQGLVVTASKTIVPESQQEPDNSPVTVTIGGQPSGGGNPPVPPPSRAVEMVLVDDDPLLWNQYDFVGLDDVSFTAPIDQVRVDAFTGGTWELDGAGNPIVTGATWEIGDETTVPDLELPTGVLPADVQGLRYTFTRVDGANWENPSTPNQTVSFQIQRRDNLNIGQGGEIDTIPVPVDLPDFNDPAPGETVAGTATNTSTAQASSSDILPDGSPVTSDIAEATDTIIFEHATNSVDVVKTPSGSQVPPGPAFTYTLSATNDGDVVVTNPVITDHLPVDAEGPMLVMADPPNYSYSLAGGTGMPTLPALVSVTDDSTDATAPTLTFEFPDGSTLPIGATYTIEYDVVLRPGLDADTEFTNDFGIVGDRQWDQCNGAAADASNPDFDAATGECLADATNSVQLAGAFSVRKLVQAEGSDQLGVTTDPAVSSADPAACATDADGFYARPCIPIAEPSGDITYRMHFINTGNRNIDRVLGIDSLPGPGDTLATVPTIPRESEWLPIFAGDRPALVDPSIGTLNVWVVSGESTCDAAPPTVADDTAAPPNLLCPDLAWVAWPDGDTLADLSLTPEQVSGLQVEILPTQPLGPAETVDVDFHMTAPPFDTGADYTAPQAQPDALTYNTVGTTGRIADLQGAPVSYTLPSEPPRVGVALADGPLRVLKVVRGDASQWAPTSFPATLSCVSAGVPVPLPDDVANLTLVPGEPQTINNLPWGAECTLTEVGNQSQTSTTSTTATVGRDSQTIRTARLVNVYDDAPLTIAKVVDSDAVDDGGDPVEYGPFTVTVRCTFRGSQVYADGYGPGDPMNIVLEDGESVTLTGIPVGARCVIAESDDKGADSVTVRVVTPGGTTSSDDRAVVQLPQGTSSATVTNAFTVGSVRIRKVIAGNDGAPGAFGPFTVTVRCTLADESGSRTVYDGQVVLGGGRPMAATVGNLPTGARCVFAETDDSDADASSITPSGGVVVGDGTVATITVTNTYTTGSVSITKIVAGDTAGAGATGPFTVSMTCTLANDLGGTNTVFDDDLVLGGNNPLSTTVEGLPTGAVCTFVETETGGATSTIDPSSGVTVGDGTVVTVTITNTFAVVPLPATGGSIDRILQLALMAVVLGAVAVIVGRTRRSAKSS